MVKTGDTNTIYESAISSKNYRDYSIGTSDNNGVYIIDTGIDSFYIHPDLYRNGDTSFQSTHFPEKYICHKNFVCCLETNDGTELFQKDATFFVRDPLALDNTTDFVLYESVNCRDFIFVVKNFV